MTAARCCPVVELRQYTLYPGTRETLIELFDREFVETQEAVGAGFLLMAFSPCRMPVRARMRPA